MDNYVCAIELYIIGLKNKHKTNPVEMTLLSEIQRPAEARSPVYVNQCSCIGAMLIYTS